MSTTAARRGRPRAFDRSRALRAAQDLIWRHGYEAMSLSQLELAMGIGKTSLYAAFGSKLGLLREAADLYLAEAGGKLRSALDAPGTTLASIRRVLEICAADFTDPSRPQGCFLVTTAPVCSEDNAEAVAFLKERRAVVAAQVRDRLRRGQREGDMPADADIDSLVEYLMTVIHGMAIQARDGSGERALMSTVVLTMAGIESVLTPRCRP